MVGCSIRNCKSRSIKGGTIRFFSFPLKESVANEWLRYCGPKTTTKNGRVCSNHFLYSDYFKPLQQILLRESPRKVRKLKPDALPTLLIDDISNQNTLSMPIEVNSQIVVTSGNMNDENITIPVAEYKQTSGNMKYFSEYNSTPADEVAGSSKIVEKIDENITIPVAEYKPTLGNMMYFPEYNTTSANEVAGPSKIVEKIDENITISVAEYKLSKRSFNEYDVLKKKLEKIFTPGQIRCFMKPNKRRVRWSAEDIAAAISLRSISPKGYRHLRSTVGIPLPAFSTLRKWASKFDIKEGLLENVVTLMKFKAKSFNELEKLVTLSFDEIYLSNKIEIDKKYEQKVGPHNNCQCVMARGLCGKWKQPIYFKCDQKMTKDILFDIIKKIYEAGLTVVSVTCDMGPGNQGLIKSLNIGIEDGKQTYFNHPSDSDLKVHVFFDVPHLLKLARNHFIDHGFVYNSKVLTKQTIEKILVISQNDLKLAHKITSYHLNVVGSQRQKVRLAAQLFSNTVAQAIKWCGIKNFLPDDNWLELSYIFKVFNDWFDVLNARMKFEGNKNAYGIKLDAQNLVLDEMNHLMGNIKTGKKTSTTPFQRGILISNKSLVHLLSDLKGRTNINLGYILTARLNQDILENFFSYIRGMGATHDHPTALSLKHRLKWYILGKHSADVFKCSTNTREDPSVSCLIAPLEKPETSFNQPDQIIVKEDVILTGILNTYVDSDNNGNDDENCSLITLLQSDALEPEKNVDNCDLAMYFPTDEEEQLLNVFETQMASNEVNEQGLKYIAGYVASRYLGKYPYLGNQTRALNPESGSCEWINFISRGKLIYPCQELISVAQIMETEFEKFHRKSLSTDKFIFKILADIVHNDVKDRYPQIDYSVILCLVRTRTYIRLKELNRNIVCNQLEKKRKRKLYKVSNTV